MDLSLFSERPCSCFAVAMVIATQAGFSSSFRSSHYFASGNGEICESETSEASLHFPRQHGRLSPRITFHYHRHAKAVVLANLSFLEAFCSPIGIRQPRIRQPLSHRVGPLVDQNANLSLYQKHRGWQVANKNGWYTSVRNSPLNTGLDELFARHLSQASNDR